MVEMLLLTFLIFLFALIELANITRQWIHSLADASAGVEGIGQAIAAFGKHSEDAVVAMPKLAEAFEVNS